MSKESVVTNVEGTVIYDEFLFELNFTWLLALCSYYVIRDC